MSAACGRRVTKLYGATRDLERDVLERGHAAEPDLGPSTASGTEAGGMSSARPRRGFRTGSLAAMRLGRRLVLMRSRRRWGTTAICANATPASVWSRR